MIKIVEKWSTVLLNNNAPFNNRKNRLNFLVLEIFEVRTTWIPL